MKLKGFQNGEYYEEELQKTNRYYISNRGGYFLATYDDGGNDKKIEAGKIRGKQRAWKTTIFNRYEKKDDYDINYKYYIREANKIKYAVEPPVYTLF